MDFARNFELYEDVKRDEFSDAWRIFYKNYTGDTSVLPQETSMQRAFVKYLNEHHGDYGAGRGIILFDGENILTRE